MKSKYRFTVFTPCYNSEKFIDRVIESLEAQIFFDFEWLVINDASTDNTGKILNEYAIKAKFPVRIIHNAVNQMLYYNFNLAFEEAKGELMVFAGHDDRFHPETLNVFDKIWKDFGNSSIAGIWCLCQDQNGVQVGNNFPDNVTISNYFEMFVDYIYKQERFGCTRTDVLKKFKFNLEGDRKGEGFLWENIGLQYQTIYINKILRTYYIENDNTPALSKRSRKKIANSVYVSYLDWVNFYLGKIEKNSLFKLRYHFALIYYGCVANLSFFKIVGSINKSTSKILAITIFPFAFSLCYIFSLLKKN